jgi:integrase
MTLSPGDAGPAALHAADCDEAHGIGRGEGRAFDEERGCLGVPSPKGGEERVFDLPLSGALIDLVRRRIEENRIVAPDSPWLFPSNSASGHVAEVRADALRDLVGHALRHLYATPLRNRYYLHSIYPNPAAT